MAVGNFSECLKVTLSHEGGWSDHPKDPGGATMKGVTLARFRQYYPNAGKEDLRRISDLDVRRIYQKDYWNVVNGDSLPYGIDLAVFDFGVNSGPARAARYLQAILGVNQDGIIGPKTLRAAQSADGRSVIKTLCKRRLSFVRGLSTWSTFGKGWSRRIADVEAKAVAMWLSRGRAPNDAERAVLEDEAHEAEKAAAAQSTGAGGAAIGGGSVAAYDFSWIGVVVLVLAVAGAAYLVWRSRQNADRAAAYKQAAAQ